MQGRLSSQKGRFSRPLTAVTGVRIPYGTPPKLLKSNGLDRRAENWLNKTLNSALQAQDVAGCVRRSRVCSPRDLASHASPQEPDAPASYFPTAPCCHRPQSRARRSTAHTRKAPRKAAQTEHFGGAMCFCRTGRDVAFQQNGRGPRMVPPTDRGARFTVGGIPTANYFQRQAGRRSTPKRSIS